MDKRAEEPQRSACPMTLLAEWAEGSRVLTSPELWPGVPSSLSFPQRRVVLGILMGGNKDFDGNGSPGGKHLGQVLSKVWHCKKGPVRRRRALGKPGQCAQKERLLLLETQHHLLTLTLLGSQI